MKTVFIAAGAMIGGAALAFTLCWVAARASGSGRRADPVEPPTEREEPPDVGI